MGSLTSAKSNVVPFPASAIVRRAPPNKARKSNRLPADHPANALSFMRPLTSKEGGGISHWNVESSGSYTTDCEIGHRLGKEYLSFVGDHPTAGNETLLGCIVIDMIASGDVGRGTVLGFMAEVNRYAMVSACTFSKREAR
jgi:hypothetical protein